MSRRKEQYILPHLNDKEGDPVKTWYIEYSYRNPSGVMERFRVYKGFEELTAQDRYKQADKIIKEFTDKILSGWTPFEDESQMSRTIDETMYHNEAAILGRYVKVKNNVTTYYINDFLKEKKLELKTKSYQTYQSKLRLFKQYLDKKKLNDVDISTISNNHIIAFLKQIQSSKSLSKVTMNKYSQILYSLFDYVRKRRHVKMDNPVVGIPRLGEIKDEAPDPISDRHRKIFGTEIPKQDPQLWLACLLMYYTALRPGEEIRLLKIRQFNFANKTITIYSTTAKNNERETIAMPDQLFDEVTNTYHLDQYPDDYYVFGVGGVPGKLCLGKNNLRNRFNFIRDALNMPKSYKFYSWKHTGASSLTETGLNTYDLQHHLRHKDIASTQKYICKRLGDKNEIIKKKFPDI